MPKYFLHISLELGYEIVRSSLGYHPNSAVPATQSKSRQSGLTAVAVSDYRWKNRILVWAALWVVSEPAIQDVGIVCDTGRMGWKCSAQQTHTRHWTRTPMDHWLALNLVVTDPRCRTRTRFIAVASEHDNINTVIIIQWLFTYHSLLIFFTWGIHPICVQKYLARQGNYFTGMLLNATFLLGVTTWWMVAISGE